MGRNVGDVLKVFCQECDKKTTQKILAVHTETDSDPLWFRNDHYFLTCGGCEYITYAVYRIHEEDLFGVHENDDSERGNWETYPPPFRGRYPVDGSEKLPRKVALIYEETLKAFDTNLNVLAGIGLRTLIEAVCTDQGQKGKIYEKIEGLAAAGVLAPTQAKMLHNHRFMGNDAAHEIVVPDKNELIMALEIAETLMKTIYVLPHLDATLTAKREAKAANP